MRVALIATTIIGSSAVLLWLRTQPDEYDKLVTHSQQHAAIRLDTTTASPVSDNVVHVPSVQVHAIVMLQKDEASALLAIDGKVAKWYRLGDEIRPDFVITDIDSNQITVRQGDAYYEFFLNKMAV